MARMADAARPDLDELDWSPEQAQRSLALAKAIRPLLKWARLLLTKTERMRFAKAYGADRALLRSAQAYQERYYPNSGGKES